MRSLSLAAALCLLPAACGGGAEAPEAPRAAAKRAAARHQAASQAKAEQGASESQQAEYTYNPIGKRDPFRSFISEREVQGIRSPTPLQRFDIDQYQLVGIVWGIQQPRAMVEDPEHVGHVLELGTYIGRNWGKVTEITGECVIVTEEYQTIRGELVTEKVDMCLPKDEVAGD